MTLEALRLRHEPQAGPQPGEASGHLHPAAKIAGRGGRVRRRCFPDRRHTGHPAGQTCSSGLADAAFAGMFVGPPLAAALGADRVHAIGWMSLVDD